MMKDDVGLVGKFEGGFRGSRPRPTLNAEGRYQDLGCCGLSISSKAFPVDHGQVKLWYGGIPL